MQFFLHRFRKNLPNAVGVYLSICGNGSHVCFWYDALALQTRFIDIFSTSPAQDAQNIRTGNEAAGWPLVNNNHDR
jgi:hypothetical protein